MHIVVVTNFASSTGIGGNTLCIGATPHQKVYVPSIGADHAHCLPRQAHDEDIEIRPAGHPHPRRLHHPLVADVVHHPQQQKPDGLPPAEAAEMVQDCRATGKQHRGRCV